MDYSKLLSEEKYYSITDLRYNDKLGYKLSQKSLYDFFDYKDECVKTGKEGFIKLDLKSFNSKYLFLYKHSSLVDLYAAYCTLVNVDNVFENIDEMKRSRIYSEIEGSLNIEGYNITRQLFDALLEGKEPKDNNERIIKNMAVAIDFVSKSNEFNEENFVKLYRIISNGCLKEHQEINKDLKYRNDMVYISTYNGADVEDIESCMNSLFKFVNDNIKNKDPFIRFMLPHIVHYYIVYIHPYFDCNGRLARMCSLWVANLLGTTNSPYFISEAINDMKMDYYKSLSATRDSRNDLTYFLEYIMNVSIKYALCYRTINEVFESMNKDGETLTQTEFYYLKKIILCTNHNSFTWKDFIKYIGIDMTKQGALKTLNKFNKYGITESRLNNKKEKVFFVKVL